ncbi:MAG: hypothetical protein M3068_02525 [Gemmatimonadota bacterium]|nr:hypothetical protein [Gemmatimonadota bacterium]
MLPLLAAVACSKGEKSAATDSAAATPPSDVSAPASAAKGAVNSTVHVSLTGGANAGSYDGKATEGGCSAGLTGKGSWGNQYSTTNEDPKAFSSLQMIVPDAKAAASGTKNFLLTVGFGPLLSQTSYELEPAKGKGTGTVKIDDHGSSGKVTFSGQTKEGVKVEGSIDCLTVLRGG